MVGEPDSPEYRVPANEEFKDFIFRVESVRSVVVRSVVFVRASVLEKQELGFNDITQIFRG